MTGGRSRPPAGGRGPSRGWWIVRARLAPLSTRPDTTEEEWRMATMTDVRPAKRIHAVWARAHDPAAGVSRWARIAAYAVPFTVLPSSLWRIAACTFHAPITRGTIDYADAPSGLPGVPLALYVILLSIASELLAF